MAPRKAKATPPVLEHEEDMEMDMEMLREELIIILQSLNQLEEHRDIMVNLEARDALGTLISKQKEAYVILTGLIRKFDPSLR
ncbi:MAG: hypothetical protein HYY29_00115 [Chloroflexi bacterium]|nr:hypothetical protein [Chloroflexota bacterium]